MKVEFDSKGYLTPHSINPISFSDFKTEFVDNFNSADRLMIYENFHKILKLLSKELIHPFHAIVFGSFVRKKMQPQDLDVVFYIHHEDYERNLDDENEFKSESLLCWLKNRAKDEYKVEVVDIQYYIKDKQHPHYDNFRINAKKLKQEFICNDGNNGKAGAVQIMFKLMKTPNLTP